MGKIKEFSETEIKEIKRLYILGNSKDVIAKQFNTSKRKIRELLNEHEVIKPEVYKLTYQERINEYNTKLINGYNYVAVCKKTGKKFNDYANISGCLSEHLISIYPEIEIPSSFLRRSYLIDNRMFWQEQYFNIIQEKDVVKIVNDTTSRDSEIVRLYISKEMSSTHKLGEKFNLGHKKISEILRENGVEINTRGGQITIGNSQEIEKSKSVRYESDKRLIAICKKTGIRFEDANNLSGCLTSYIVETYGDVNIPNNTYQRKKYELEHGKKWFEEYFDIVEEDELIIIE